MNFRSENAIDIRVAQEEDEEMSTQVVELMLSEGDDDAFIFANLTPADARAIASGLLHYAGEIEAGR